jgi:hypothetical protein
VSGVRGRRITAFLTAGLLALAAAGCGGGDDVAPEVPGPPADVTIPESSEAPAAAASNQDESTTDETGTGETGTGTTDDTGTTTPEEAAPTDDTGATTPDASGGTTAPEATPDGPTNDTPPPEGSNAEQFEDFCAQNPGAC